MSLHKNIMAVRALLSFIVAVAYTGSMDAGIGEWKNYTATNNVRAVVQEGNRLWVGTSGGVFRYDISDSSYRQFNNTSGLTTNDITAMAVDKHGAIWIGQANGSLDVYNPSTDSWRSISDIANSIRINKRITSIVMSGDSVYIGSGFGVSLFLISKFEFKETYFNFASASQPFVYGLVVLNRQAYVATNNGVFVSKANAINLALPESWDTLSINGTGMSISQLHDSVYVGLSSGLHVVRNNALVPVSSIPLIRTLFATDSTLLFASRSTLYSFSNNGVSALTSTPDSAVCGTVVSSFIFLGFNDLGFGQLLSGWSFLSPNSPASNLFADIVVDNDNVLWAASGRSFGKGFYSFDGKRWKNYNVGNTPLLGTNDCFAVSLGPNNSKWVGNWGSGLTVVDKAGQVVRRFDYSYPGFIGVLNQNTNLPDYTVPGKIGVDQQGNVWVTIYNSLSQTQVIWKMNPDSTWESFPGAPYGTRSFMFHIVVDQNDTKWFVNAVPGRGANPGSIAAFFDESKQLSNTTDGWGAVTENDGATSSAVYSVVVDESGYIWLGTGTGITIITDPNKPLSGVTKVFLGAVRDQVVQCIAVDPLNNKWVGTTQGVFVLSPDGTQLLNQYSVENTGGKLVDNTIYSIAFDKRHGIAYFGTEKGLSSLEIAAVATKSSMSTIDLSPNPVYLPTHGAVEIRGLVEESTIKVLSIYGKVLKQFPAQGGGRAFWDCTDGEGNSVATGVYIIVAHDRNGTQVASAKVAVIRK